MKTNAVLELTPEKTQKRIQQANEMAAIWEQSDIATQMYLKGCIVTAQAFSSNAFILNTQIGN